MNLLRSVFIITVCCQYYTLTDSKSVQTLDNTIQTSNETFMYFAYGSNLLSKRIHFRNPTAVRRGIGKLKDYRLDFNKHMQSWNGCVATIIEHNGRNVWGAIWEIDMANMEDLDRQEGVDRNLYKAITRDVETPTGEKITCRVYQMVRNPVEPYRLEDLPFDRQPSRTYFNCITKGAEESQLPTDYINHLKKIRHNNRDTEDLVYRELC